MIDGLVSDLPNAERGFRLLFSAAPFPGFQVKLEAPAFLYAKAEAMSDRRQMDNAQPRPIVARELSTCTFKAWAFPWLLVLRNLH